MYWKLNLCLNHIENDIKFKCYLFKNAIKQKITLLDRHYTIYLIYTKSIMQVWNVMII